jgi:prepilin-type N-terminal cleavage/methylation domain-containing protein
MPRGTTLLEMLLVLVILSIITAATTPAIGSLRDHLAVDQSADLVAGAHARARLVSSVERRVTLLTLTADSLVLRVVESPTDTVVRWRAEGPAGDDVAVSGFPRTIAFGPTGIAFGVANGSYRFDRGWASRQVIVSRYGRVRLQ